MANGKEIGIFQLENGYWGYRFSLLIEGKRVSKRRTVDQNGNKLKTKSAAAAAREEAIREAYIERKRKKVIVRRKMQEVYQEYCDSGRKDKAFTTIKRQDSLWRNHIGSAFGNCYIDEISAAAVNDYLALLYYEKGFSYRYVEGFLKFFYLIFGQAYSRDYLEIDIYNKLCRNKDTKIHMPKLKTDDNLDIVYYNKSQLELLDKFFKGKNVETAYMIGRYCGVRINECFGLKWDNVDLQQGTIFIDRQMQYQDGIIKLVPVKTINSKRILYMNDKLKDYMTRLYWKKEILQQENEKLIRQNQRFIEDLDGSYISSTEMVNCLPDGKLQTVTSFKYHSRELKNKYNLDFKFHYLRHTYGTMMAELNTPTHLLCDQMGHGKIEVTKSYYLAISKKGIDILRENLSQL